METEVKPKGFPSHKVCEQNVKNPTLVCKNGLGVWLQWFGESDSFDLSEKQFLFPTNLKSRDFFNQPENFEIVMVGPIKNWPNKEAISDIVKQYGSAEKIIVYYISSKFGVSNGDDQIVPAAGISPLTIKLFDENCGIINPREFFDDFVRINAIKKLQNS